MNKLKKTLISLWFIPLFIFLFKVSGNTDLIVFLLPKAAWLFFLYKTFYSLLLGYVFAYGLEQIYEAHIKKLAFDHRRRRLVLSLFYLLLQLLLVLSDSTIYATLLERMPTSALFISFLLRAFLSFFYVYFSIRYISKNTISFPELSFSEFFFCLALLLASLLNNVKFDAQSNYIYLFFVFLSACSEFVLYAFLSSSMCQTIDSSATNSKKQLLLVNVNAGSVWSALSYIIRNKYSPFFSVLKARTPKDWDVSVQAFDFWHDWHIPENGLLAISCCSSNAFRAYAIAKKCRSKGLKVVIGGPHVSYNLREAQLFADAVVVGEAENVWTQICEDFLADKLESVYQGNVEDDFIASTHKELTSVSPSLSKDFIEYARGCKFACKFCSIPVLAFKKLRYQSLDKLIAQIKHIKKKYKTIEFIDNNVFSDKKYADELFKALAPLKIKWSAGTSIDLGAHKDSLALAKASGLKDVLIGYEIADSNIERDVSKKFAFIDKYLEYSKNIKKHGIKIKAGFVYGFDTDNWSYLLKALSFFSRLRPFSGSATILTPLPGTVLFSEYLAADRILDLNWKNYDLRHRVFSVKQGSCLAFMLRFYLLRYISFFVFTTIGSFLAILLVLMISILMRLLA